VEQVLAAKHGDVPAVVTVNGRDKVRQAVDVLQEFGISQAPVVREPSTEVAQFVGSIQERALLDRVFRDPDALQADVAEVMGPPIRMVESDEPVEVAFAELQREPAVLVAKAGRALGVLTRSDLLEFLAHRPRTPDTGALARHRRRVRKGLDAVLLDAARTILDTHRRCVPRASSRSSRISTPTSWRSMPADVGAVRALAADGARAQVVRHPVLQHTSTSGWPSTPSSSG